MESDCLILVETCRGNTIRREIEQIVMDIQKLKENFTSIGFLWTKREGNRVGGEDAARRCTDQLND